MSTTWPPPLPSPRSATSTDPRPVAKRRTPRRRLLAAAALVVPLVGISMLVEFGAFFVVPLLFVLVVPFEKMFPRHRGQRIRRPGVGTDIAHALSAPALAVAGTAVAIVVGLISLAWIPGLLLRPLVAMLPVAVLPFVGIALFDMTVYWVHRWSHEVPFLWKFHSVHHSSEKMDWISGFRNHPFDGAIVAPPFFLLIAAGFDATFTGVLAIVQLVTGLFLHANVRWRVKPLHRVVITPEFHHWHHANEADAHNTNYSTFLPLWDTIFGTYFMPADRRPQRYGISEPMAPTIAGQLRHPFRGAENPICLLRHPWRSLRAGFTCARKITGDVWRSTRRPVRARAG